MQNKVEGFVSNTTYYQDLAGLLISTMGYHRMFVVMAAFNVAAILVYFFWASRHPSSFSYRLKHQNEQH